MSAQGMTGFVNLQEYEAIQTLQATRHWAQLVNFVNFEWVFLQEH